MLVVQLREACEKYIEIKTQINTCNEQAKELRKQLKILDAQLLKFMKDSQNEMLRIGEDKVITLKNKNRVGTINKDGVLKIAAQFMNSETYKLFEEAVGEACAKKDAQELALEVQVKDFVKI